MLQLVTQLPILSREVIKYAGFTGLVDSAATFPGVNPFPKTRGQSMPQTHTIVPQSPSNVANLEPSSTEKETPLPVAVSDRPEVNLDDLDGFVTFVEDGGR